jgi:hypothetical protein
LHNWVATIRANGHSWCVPITREQFVERLAATCPELEPLIVEHFEYYEELLLHLLVADVRLFAISAFENGDLDVLERCLAVMSAGLEDGDDYVKNAVAVSFVEDTGWWEPGMGAFIDAWPGALQAEDRRQRDRRPEST